MNRKLKKYNLKYEYLKLEEEDVSDELTTFVTDFESRFIRYYNNPKPSKGSNEVWVNEETGEVRDDAPPNLGDFTKHWEEAKRVTEERERAQIEKLAELRNRPDKLKKLYKKLAAHVHPDRGGSNALFQEVNKAYESNNLMTLLTKAGEYGIDYDVDDDDEQILERNLKELELEIHRKKSTLAWLWGRGSKKERLYVITEVERQTGYKVEKEVLPDDLVEKEEKTLLILSGSL